MLPTVIEALMVGLTLAGLAYTLLALWMCASVCGGAAGS